MKAAAWIDRVKQARGWDSDYRVSKELGLSRQAISDYRVGRSLMDEDAALKVAAALGEPIEIVLIDQAAERVKSPEARSALGDALRRLGGAAAAILIAAGFGGFPNGNNGLGAHAEVTDIYIASNKKKRRRKKQADATPRKQATWFPQCAMA